jgi:predicted kinase
VACRSLESRQWLAESASTGRQLSSVWIKSTRSVGGDGQISRSEWKETHQIALAHLEKLSASGQDIVIDDTNCFRFLRDSYRNLGSRLNYRTVIVQMTLSS